MRLLFVISSVVICGIVDGNVLETLGALLEATVLMKTQDSRPTNTPTDRDGSHGSPATKTKKVPASVQSDVEIAVDQGKKGNVGANLKRGKADKQLKARLERKENEQKLKEEQRLREVSAIEKRRQEEIQREKEERLEEQRRREETDRVKAAEKKRHEEERVKAEKRRLKDEKRKAREEKLRLQKERRRQEEERRRQEEEHRHQEEERLRQEEERRRQEEERRRQEEERRRQEDQIKAAKAKEEQRQNEEKERERRKEEQLSIEEKQREEKLIKAAEEQRAKEEGRRAKEEEERVKEEEQRVKEEEQRVKEEERRAKEEQRAQEGQRLLREDREKAIAGLKALLPGDGWDDAIAKLSTEDIKTVSSDPTCFILSYGKGSSFTPPKLGNCQDDVIRAVQKTKAHVYKQFSKMPEVEARIYPAVKEWLEKASTPLSYAQINKVLDIIYGTLQSQNSLMAKLSNFIVRNGEKKGRTFRQKVQIKPSATLAAFAGEINKQLLPVDDLLKEAVGEIFYQRNLYKLPTDEKIDAYKTYRDMGGNKQMFILRYSGLGIPIKSWSDGKNDSELEANAVQIIKEHADARGHEFMNGFPTKQLFDYFIDQQNSTWYDLPMADYVYRKEFEGDLETTMKRIRSVANKECDNCGLDECPLTISRKSVEQAITDAISGWKGCRLNYEKRQEALRTYPTWFISQYYKGLEPANTKALELLIAQPKEHRAEFMIRTLFEGQMKGEFKASSNACQALAKEIHKLDYNTIRIPLVGWLENWTDCAKTLPKVLAVLHIQPGELLTSIQLQRRVLSDLFIEYSRLAPPEEVSKLIATLLGKFDARVSNHVVHTLDRRPGNTLKNILEVQMKEACRNIK